ncbi:MAG: hypothetical protein ACAF41_00985 (plasmid) [Leptolyngbya sp. BL-A-14]
MKTSDLINQLTGGPSSLQTPGASQGLNDLLQSSGNSASYAASETSGSSPVQDLIHRLFHDQSLDNPPPSFFDSNSKDNQITSLDDPPPSFFDSNSKDNQITSIRFDPNVLSGLPLEDPEPIPFQGSDDGNQQGGSNFVFSNSPFAIVSYLSNTAADNSDAAKPAAYSYADTNAYQDGSLGQGSVRYGAVADWGVGANYDTQFSTDNQILPGVELKTDGTVNAQAGISARAAGEVGLALTPDGLQTYAQGDLTAAADASANANLNATAAIPGLDTSVGAGGQGHADAFAGAQVTGQIGVTVSPDDASVNLDGGGFAGAKASVDGSAALSVNGEQLAEIHGDAGVRAGIGASGKLDAGYDNGTLHLDMGAGFALGVGAEADWGISVQVPDFVGDQIVGDVKAATDFVSGEIDAGSDLVSGATNAVSDLASGLGDAFSDLSSGNIADAGYDVVSSALDAGSDVVSSALDAGYDLASGTVDAAIDLGVGAVNTVADVASDAVSVASDVVSGAASLVSKVLPF